MTSRTPLLLNAIARLPSARLPLLLAAVLLVSAVRPSPSNAAIRTVNGVDYGVQIESTAPPAVPVTPLPTQGGPVVHSSAPYAIIWDPGTTLGGYEAFVQSFMAGYGAESGALSNVFDVASQYGDASGKAAYNDTFRGAYTDTDPYPKTLNCAEGAPCLTDVQIRTELAKYITANGLPTGLNPTGGPTPTYFIFTPSGTTVCLEGSAEAGHCSKSGVGEPLCSYHSFTTVSSATVLYAVEPFTLRTGCQDGSGTIDSPEKELEADLLAPAADVLVNDVAAEQVAMVTDPLLNGWRETSGERDEVPDKCRNFFSPIGNPPTAFDQIIAGVNYYVNDEFNQAALYQGYPARPCVPSVIEQPKFTTPNPVRSGDAVTFNATSSWVDLGVAKYNWTFGDGKGAEVNCEGRVPTYGFAPAECNSSSGTDNPNPVASVVHRYSYGGTYEVTLTITDGGGNVASTADTITVTGPAPPPPSPAHEGTTGSASTSQSTAGPGSTQAGVTPPAPTVLATQSVVSQSLPSALRDGIVVRYSVSEQVAGRFEVLLASSLARRVGLHGASATGLAKGTSAQTVIAKAILVTTKGGHSVYRIKFSKATAAKLRRLRRVTLTIRMLVHSAKSPTVTTVLDTVHLR